MHYFGGSLWLDPHVTCSVGAFVLSDSEYRTPHRRDRRMCPTQKPIEIVARPIRYHTKPGELIFEPFSGSGTAFVAPKRKAGGAMEVSPAFAAAC